MSGVRLIASGDDFPWERAFEALRSMEDTQLTPKDFTQMIETGRRIGWSPQLVAANEQLAAGGRCFDVNQSAAPQLMGSLFEDNIFFMFTSQAHEESCKPIIRRLADHLGLVVV